MKPFRFAAGIRNTSTRAEFVEGVREVERLGYSSLMLSDHLVDQFGPISALGVAAAVTTTLRLGTFVFNNDLRHPVVLAQELATLDRLSDGRLEIGIGAGWNKPEYDGAGITYDPGTVRIDRLAESITVMKGVFADGPINFQGRCYRVKGFEDLPRPVQRPHPPFLLGGGSPKLLRFAAQNAQIVGIAPRVMPDGQADVMGCTLAGSEAKVSIIREAAAARFEELEINTYPPSRPGSRIRRGLRRARSPTELGGATVWNFPMTTSSRRPTSSSAASAASSRSSRCFANGCTPTISSSARTSATSRRSSNGSAAHDRFLAAARFAANTARALARPARRRASVCGSVIRRRRRTPVVGRPAGRPTRLAVRVAPPETDDTRCTA